MSLHVTLLPHFSVCFTMARCLTHVFINEYFVDPGDVIRPMIEHYNYSPLLTEFLSSSSGCTTITVNICIYTFDFFLHRGDHFAAVAAAAAGCAICSRFHEQKGYHARLHVIEWRQNTLRAALDTTLTTVTATSADDCVVSLRTKFSWCALIVPSSAVVLGWVTLNFGKTNGFISIIDPELRENKWYTLLTPPLANSNRQTTRCCS